MERSQGIISVFDKRGVVEFCKAISPHFTLYSTGNTAQLLESSEIQVKTVSSLTEFPEMLDGRVKTLHPKIMGGILGTSAHQNELEEMNILPFGLVVSNLYPFEQVV
ncbi:MAG: hypothetical protein P1Q69_18085, partial [Candidatus Thorarchaeota archaeon]|nr:hypothetical protein [Candidatus Thorarchaeota archaeon]